MDQTEAGSPPPEKEKEELPVGARGRVHRGRVDGGRGDLRAAGRRQRGGRGRAVWLSFLIAGAIAGLQGYSFARLGARYPSAGACSSTSRRDSATEHFTGFTAWLLYAANAIVTAMVAVSFGSDDSAMLTGGRAPSG